MIQSKEFLALEERKRLAIVAWFAGEGITNCKEFCKEMAQIADAAFSGANGRVTWLALAKSAALFGCSVARTAGLTDIREEMLQKIYR